MTNNDTSTAVRIKHVKKHFHLIHEKQDSLKLQILNHFKKNRRMGHDVYKALIDIDIDIKKGEFIGILGRNGAGKSTLLKIIAEIYQPTSGSVTVNGKLVPFIELGVGFNPNLSGRDNVYLNGAILGFTRSEMDSMYDSIVDFAELREFMDQKLKNYSSGMQVRLAFSVAIQADADILLLDEVLAVGDASFQKKCYEYFDSLKESKKTIILVSHSMGVIRQYCDRAVLIDGGRVAYDGTADQVADEYLKLFNTASDVKKTEHSQNKRWGTGEVFIDRVDLDTEKDRLAITATISSKNYSIHDAKFGFRIKDLEGKVLMGANNLNVNGGGKIPFQAHETKRLTFSMPNILGNGKYSISATINSSIGDTVYDNWEDILTIHEEKDDVFYPLLAPANLEIETITR